MGQKLIALREQRRREEVRSHLLLFCALLTAKVSKTPVGDVVSVVPLSGGAKALAGQLIGDGI